MAHEYEAFDDFLGAIRLSVHQTVHFVTSKTPLLSGALADCVDPKNKTYKGGVAAVGAMLRFYSQGQPSLVVPFGDIQSPFVQMHPSGWSVNFVVLHEIMGWKVFAGSTALLTQNSVDFNVSQRDISDLQNKKMPFLLTNAMIPPSLSWYEYTVPVFFDDATGLAVLSIYNAKDPMNYPQVESTLGMLNYVARASAESGCNSDSVPRLIDSYGESDRRCWVPIIIFSDIQENFDRFLNAVVEHEHPPALIIFSEGDGDGEPQRVGSKGVWVVNFSIHKDTYFHTKISLNSKLGKVESVDVIIDDLIALNTTDTLKDDEYRSNIMALHKLAVEANFNNPVVGNTSTPMPVALDDSYRRCKAGECEIGNLFMDAARWKCNTDVAFSTSGGYRGEGWPAGEVKVSNLWDSLPFPDELCTGVMNGVSLFRLFNYSINVATFEGEDTDHGDRLLQVSGMRIVYNTEMQGNRLVSMEVWDMKQNTFLPVQRLQLYSFVTDSYTCAGFDPYPDFLGKSLIGPGEKPSKLMDGSLEQDVLADYLRQLTTPYKCGIEGRLTNDTSATVPLNLIQSSTDCGVGTFWKAEIASCELCPRNLKIFFLNNRVEFEFVTGSEFHEIGNISMVNTEAFNISYVPKTKPSWLNISGVVLDFIGTTRAMGDDFPNTLSNGERATILLDVATVQLEPGTAEGTVSLVFSAADYPDCPGEERSFEVITRVLPEPSCNYLGSIRYFGLALAGVVLLTSLILISWVLWKRNLRIVTTLQPVFLVMISFGVLVMALAIVPLSIDDEIASVKLCDMACISIPWLLSMGFTIAMSSLFSKLWRINKLFQGSMKRGLKVAKKDVMIPFAILFTLNFMFLLVWTLVSPLAWTRIEIKGESWNTVGTCRSSPDDHDSGSISMLALVAAVNVFALFVAFYQAYQARNISDEFSESKYVAIALFSWIQILIVGFPVLFLIGPDNAGARYLLEVLLVFAVSISMLSLIFGPIIVQAYFSVPKNPRDGNRGSVFFTSFTVRSIGQTKVSGLFESFTNGQSENTSFRLGNNNLFMSSQDTETQEKDSYNMGDFDHHCELEPLPEIEGSSGEQADDGRLVHRNAAGRAFGQELRQRYEDVLKNALDSEYSSNK